MYSVHLSYDGGSFFLCRVNDVNPGGLVVFYRLFQASALVSVEMPRISNPFS